MLNKLSQLFLAGFLGAILCGCTAEIPAADANKGPITTGTNTPEVTVVVTRDFGSAVLLEQTVAIEPGTTAMAALQMVASVETKYGGGFVSTINGISSKYEGANKSQKDWLFYVNGLSSSLGAKDYILQDGDIEQWDFRDWSYHQYIPAIIGNFPQPFLSGHRGKLKPTVVVYETQFEDIAQSLADRLRKEGVREVSAAAYDQLSEAGREQSNLILVGRPDNELISELNGAHKKLGFYAYFQEGKLVVLNAEGEVNSEHEGGLIEATRNSWHPKGIGSGESTVWIISGTDDSGVRDTASAVINNYDDLRFAYAIVVINGEIVRIPQ